MVGSYGIRGSACHEDIRCTASGLVRTGIWHRSVGGWVWCSFPRCLGSWPVFTWGPWFARGYKTDLYEYASLSSLLTDHSLLSLRSLDQAQASGNITSGAGVVWRSIDSVTASFMSQVFGLRPWAGSWLSASSSSGVRGHRLAFADSRGRSVLFLACVGLLCPVLTALFLENYFSQNYFVALIPSFVLLLSWVWTRERTLSPQTWALGSGAAVMIAVYPYFFGLVALACAAILALTPGHARESPSTGDPRDAQSRTAHQSRAAPGPQLREDYAVQRRPRRHRPGLADRALGYHAK